MIDSYRLGASKMDVRNTDTGDPGSHEPDHGRSSDFRRKAIVGLAAAAGVLLSPFSLNNFLQGRYLLGFGSLMVVIYVAFHGWRVRHGRDSPLFIMAVVPLIIVFLMVSLRQQGIIGVLWCYPALVSFYVVLPERQAWLANAAMLAVVVPQAWFVMDHALVARMVATLASVSIFTAVFVRVITNQQDRLHAIAVTDALTGLYNRSRLMETLERAIERNRRTGSPMMLITLDLDHFKKINDTLGHDTGDSVLRKVGQLLRDRLRGVDSVFRLGGEEFLVLLDDTSMEDGLRVAEELRASVAASEILPGQTVTISIGAAPLEADDQALDWMKRADASLYQAKLAGRNQVVAS